MNDRLLPALVAANFGALLALALLVPYVAVQYRRRGTFGLRRAVVALASLVYALALVAYVLLPLPPVGPDFCLAYGVDPQLRPFQFVADIVREGVSSPTAVVTNPAAWGVAFNIMLFIPFGVLFRYLTGRSIAITALAGAAISVLVELTQLTGVWSLFPCAYRLFDVDDFMTNTAGALIGAMAVGPMLRSLPSKEVEGRSETPRPLTTRRRLLGMLCDFLAVMLTGAALNMIANVVGPPIGLPPSVEVIRTLFWLVPALAQLGLVWWTGATLGEHCIRVRPTLPTEDLSVRAKLLRWVLGIGGFCLLNVTGAGITTLAAFLLAAANVAATAFTYRHRGLAYAAASLGITDTRSIEPPVGDEPSASRKQ